MCNLLKSRVSKIHLMQGLGLNEKKKFVPSKYISTHCSRVFMKIDTDSEEPRRSIAGSILTVVDLNDPGFIDI